MARRISFDITMDQGNELKAFCAKHGFTIRGYFLNLVRQDWENLNNEIKKDIKMHSISSKYDERDLLPDIWL